MSTTRNKRLQHKLAAAKALEANAGPIMGLLAGVVEDLGEEVEGLNQFQQDAEMAAELAYRLDNAIKVTDAHFGMEVNENYGQKEIDDIIAAIEKVEKAYMK